MKPQNRMRTLVAVIIAAVAVGYYADVLYLVFGQIPAPWTLAAATMITNPRQGQDTTLSGLGNKHE